MRFYLCFFFFSVLLNYFMFSNFLPTFSDLSFNYWKYWSCMF
jgi:hypothetical protein